MQGVPRSVKKERNSEFQQVGEKGEAGEDIGEGEVQEGDAGREEEGEEE